MIKINCLIGVQCTVESYQRLKKWYLLPPRLTLSFIRYVSRVKWSKPGKRVVPSPTPRCSTYWKGSLQIALNYRRQLNLLTIMYGISTLTHIAIFFYLADTIVHHRKINECSSLTNWRKITVFKINQSIIISFFLSFFLLFISKGFKIISVDQYT